MAVLQDQVVCDTDALNDEDSDEVGVLARGAQLSTFSPKSSSVSSCSGFVTIINYKRLLVPPIRKFTTNLSEPFNKLETTMVSLLSGSCLLMILYNTIRNPFSKTSTLCKSMA